MSLSRPPVRRPVVVPLLVALLAAGLSGCGVAGTSFQPGVAARVGDETITTREVDSLAGLYCSSIGRQLADQKQAVPQRYLRGGVVAQLAREAGARQLAASSGVEAGADYRQALAQIHDKVAGMPDDQADAVTTVDAAGAYVQSVTTAIGEKELGQQGTTSSNQDAARAAGEQVLGRWFRDHEVRIDPQYGVALRDGRTVASDQSVSYAVSDAAKQGQAARPDPSYAAALPDAQRCG